MKEKIYFGYCRVSSAGQNIERQKVELNNFGVLDENIFTDYVSGKDFNRVGYQNLRDKLSENDVLVLKSLDRLGRNYQEIKDEWSYITKIKKSDIVILDMPLLDTRVNKDLIGVLISDIILQLLSYVAQTERELIRQRQSEGIAIAKANGKHLGRPLKPYPKGFNSIYNQIVNKEITKLKASQNLNINYNSLLRFCKRKAGEV